ncbi:unnamed protein product [Chilo suppressalis]|uniref:Uncharacterized protein n=1 Tax=Chilo suppressalis TaxID=168631 RepID=A0ABN8L6C7_CHISP|nr:unnamed protein product [Chilo suppressalis]
MGGNKVVLFVLITAMNYICSAHQKALRNGVITIQDDDESGANENDETINGDNNKQDDSSTSAEALPATETLIEIDDRARPLTVGDIFTTSELLPVAEKLIAKVENPGMGKGIVSSSKSPQHLADKLFEQFFLTNKRIVTLSAFDISGLDALQALALSGEAAYLRSYIDSTVEQVTMIDYKGQNIAVNTEPKKSKYRLLLKNGKPKLKKKIAFQKRNEDLVKEAKAKNLLRMALKVVQDSRNGTLKKGPIKINATNRSKVNNIKKDIKGNPKGPSKSKLRTNKVTSKATAQELKGGKPKGPPKPKLSTNEVNSKVDAQKPKEDKIKKPLCTWKYVCSDPSELDSCKLQTECNKQYRKDARKDSIDVGITLVDEEVEKILETRVINLRPSKGGQELERLESLAEYFNNIVMAEALKRETTTPYNEESTYPMEPSGDESNRKGIGDEEITYSDSVRRILKKPVRSKANTTPKRAIT